METDQKTREGCGCFRGLCRSSAGKFRENSGQIAGKCFPNREMLQIPGFRAPGKANLSETLGPHCRDLVPTFRAGCFLKSTVPAFSSFSEQIDFLDRKHLLHPRKTKPTTSLALPSTVQVSTSCNDAQLSGNAPVRSSKDASSFHAEILS